jgi:hypothetical protein
MVFQFSDFEDETVGELPSGWSLIKDSSPDTTYEVSDSDPIEGKKSLILADQAGGVVIVEHGVGDETIQFAADINRAAERQSTWYGCEHVAYDSNGNVLWDYFFASDSDSGPLDIYFATGREQNPDRGNRELGTKVGELGLGFHNIAFEDPLNNLTLRVDENVVHETGQSFSGASAFRIVVDDYIGKYDRGAENNSQFALVVREELALRGGVVSQGDEAVVHTKNSGRVHKDQQVGDEVVLVAEDLAQP